MKKNKTKLNMVIGIRDLFFVFDCPTPVLENAFFNINFLDNEILNLFNKICSHENNFCSN